MADTRTNDALNHDSDEDVLGFADKPYPRDHPETGPAAPEDQPQDIPIDDRNVNENTTTTTTTTATNNPPTDIQEERAKLTGWVSDVEGALSVFSLIIPWASSMAFSWTPYTRVSPHEAPYEVRVIAILSTVEFGTIMLFFLTACIRSLSKSTNINATPSGTSTPAASLSEAITRLWLVFLLVSPISSGAWAWLQATNHYGCKDDPLGARCRVGKRLMSAIGAYRVFVVVPLMLSMVMLIEWFVKRSLRKIQAKEDEERAREGVPVNT